jgi:hypothetical protein
MEAGMECTASVEAASMGTSLESAKSKRMDKFCNTGNTGFAEALAEAESAILWRPPSKKASTIYSL